MPSRVCPWWIGYLLVSPLRHLRQNPRTILQPFVREGMTVLEPGCGMGFFTVEIARLVGPQGKVIAVDLQRRMLNGLRRRASRAGLADRIEARETQADRLDIDDLAAQIDFALAFAVVHELPDAGRFFGQLYAALKPAGRVLLSEPQGHVTDGEFAATVAVAEHAGFQVTDQPTISGSRSVVLEKR